MGNLILNFQDQDIAHSGLTVSVTVIVSMFVVQLIATLTELSQGPCPGNQHCIAHNGVLEGVADVWEALHVAQSHGPSKRLPGASSYGHWECLSALAASKVS